MSTFNSLNINMLRSCSCLLIQSGIYRHILVESQFCSGQLQLCYYEDTIDRHIKLLTIVYACVILLWYMPNPKPYRIPDHQRGHRRPLSTDGPSRVISLRVVEEIWLWWQKLTPVQRRNLIEHAYNNLPISD